MGKPLYVTSGRIAIAIALQRMGVGLGDEVLVPAYHCKSMLDPVRWTGAEPVLYKVGGDLSIDMQDLHEKLGPSTRCLMIVHYFGFPQDLGPVIELCRDRGICLLEDCAHALYGQYRGRPLGSFGDFAIASPMKFHPIYDGGCLVSTTGPVSGERLHGAGGQFEIKALLNPIERAVAYGRLRPLNWLLAFPLKLKHWLWTRTKRWRGPSAQRGVGPAASDGGYDFDPFWLDKRMSRTSQWILRHSAVDAQVRRRRSIYRRMLAAVSALEGCRALYPSLPNDVVPYVFPLVVEDHRRVFDRLKRAGVPIFRWEDVVVGVCHVSTSYSRTLLQVPCHQDLTDAEVDWILKEIQEAVA